MMKKNDEKEISRLLLSIQDIDAVSNYQKIVDTLLKVIELNPKDKAHWEELLNFVYFNYSETDPYDWDDLLLQGIKIAKKSREYIKDSDFLSLSFLFQYKFCVELIKMDSYFSQEYDDNILEQLLKCSLQNNPENALALQSLADLYQSNCGYEKADPLYRKVLERERDINTIHDLALNDQLRGNNEEAVKLYWELYEEAEAKEIKGVALNNIIKIYKKENNIEKTDYYTNLLNNIL